MINGNGTILIKDIKDLAKCEEWAEVGGVSVITKDKLFYPQGIDYYSEIAKKIRYTQVMERVKE